MQLLPPVELLVLMAVGAVVVIAACLAFLVGRRRRGGDPAAVTPADWTGERQAEIVEAAPAPQAAPARTVADAIAARQADTDSFAIVRSGAGGTAVADRGSSSADATSSTDGRSPSPDPPSDTADHVSGIPGRFATVDALEPDVATTDLSTTTQSAPGLDWLAATSARRSTDPDHLVETGDGAQPANRSGSASPTTSRTVAATDRSTPSGRGTADAVVVRGDAEAGSASPAVTSNGSDAGAATSTPLPGSHAADTGSGSPSPRPTTAAASPGPTSGARPERGGGAAAPVTWRGVERERPSSPTTAPPSRGGPDPAPVTPGGAPASPTEPRRDRGGSRGAPHPLSTEPAGDGPRSSPFDGSAPTGTVRRPRGWTGADSWFVPPGAGPRGSAGAGRPPSPPPQAGSASSPAAAPPRRAASAAPSPGPRVNAGDTDPATRPAPRSSSPSPSTPPDRDRAVPAAPADGGAPTQTVAPGDGPTGTASLPASQVSTAAQSEVSPPVSAIGSSRPLAAAVANALAARAVTPGTDPRDDARDRLLAVLLDDHQRVVRAVVDLQKCQEGIGRLADDEHGGLGDALSRLAHSGLRTDQLARLSGLPTDTVAELLGRGVS